MVTMALTLVGMTEEALHYRGTNTGGATVDVLIPKVGQADPPPRTIVVSLDVPESTKTTGAGWPAPDERPAATQVQPGSQVTIVKSRIAGAKYPPEWLDQFLGKKGTVLWVTEKGAMVRIGTDATWFAYPELEATD
jgi:hypothetical protein